MITSRRSLLTGLGASLIAAPSIVRASSLMPVRGVIMSIDPAIDPPLHALLRSTTLLYHIEYTTDGKVRVRLEKEPINFYGFKSVRLGE